MSVMAMLRQPTLPSKKGVLPLSYLTVHPSRNGVLCFAAISALAIVTVSRGPWTFSKMWARPWPVDTAQDLAAVGNDICSGGGCMLGRLIEGVFGCRHSRCSFPVTVRRGTRSNEAASLTGTYVVCLDCGKEFPYDWKEMKVVSTRWEKRHHLRSLATKETA